MMRKLTFTLLCMSLIIAVNISTAAAEPAKSVQVTPFVGVLFTKPRTKKRRRT